MTDKSLELQIKIATAEAAAAVSSLKGELEAFASEATKLTGSDGSSLAGTFAKTQEEAEKAAASFNLFGGSSAELRRVQSELKSAAVELVRNGIDPQSEEVKKLVEEYKKLEKAAGDIDEANGSNIDSFGKLKNSIMNLAEVAAALKTLSIIKDMGAFALQTADNFQTARNQFGILLGDMEAGAGLFNEIKAFNDVTPFDLDTLTQATNVLIAAKVPLQDLQAQLTKFGDLSQGNSQKMTSYVNAFSQVAAKGKADMQVLNTYLHQGVPILDALAKNFNVTTAEIVKMSSDGQISFNDFSKALDDLTATGGQYFGGMELASKSLAAMQEGLNEAVNSLAASFGDMLMPAAAAVVQALTDITNVINESPLLKGILAGALVFITGYLAAMAVKAGIAFAAQMAFNLSVGALSPVALAATLAVAGMAAGYIAYSAKLQSAKKESEDFAYQQRKQKDAVDSAREAVEAFSNAVKTMSDDSLSRNINVINSEIAELGKNIKEYSELAAKNYSQGNISRAQYWTEIAKTEREQLNQALKGMESILNEINERRINWIDLMFGNTQAGKAELEINKINEQLAIARKYLSDPNLGGTDQSKLQEIIRSLTADLEKLTNKGDEINRKAAEWKEEWTDFIEKFQADQSIDPFAVNEYERDKRFKDARKKGVILDKELIDEVNEYFNVQRGEIIEQLAKEEERLQRDLSRTKIDNIEFELDEALRAVEKLEAQRVTAAADSEEEIAAIRKRFAEMRKDTVLNFKIEINKTKLDEAREAVKNWQEELSDGLLTALTDMEVFSVQASVIIGDLIAQFIELSASAALSGFEEFGRALGEGTNAAESLQAALASTARQILQQLPMMFLQAGLQLIANGQWPLGLGFIAAAGSSAIISGYVDGAAKHAQGGVFDEYGNAARAFASGGTFTNQIVNEPTYFKYGGSLASGGSLGVMGEAGPEAVMPLIRMPDGSLGVEAGNAGSARVIVNIINNSGAEVRQEESEDADGNVQIDVMIGEMVNRHIASGKADRAMGGRYGLRAAGV